MAFCLSAWCGFFMYVRACVEKGGRVRGASRESRDSSAVLAVDNLEKKVVFL